MSNTSTKTKTVTEPKPAKGIRGPKPSEVRYLSDDREGRIRLPLPTGVASLDKAGIDLARAITKRAAAMKEAEAAERAALDAAQADRVALVEHLMGDDDDAEIDDAEIPTSAATSKARARARQALEIRDAMSDVVRKLAARVFREVADNAAEIKEHNLAEARRSAAQLSSATFAVDHALNALNRQLGLYEAAARYEALAERSGGVQRVLEVRDVPASYAAGMGLAAMLDGLDAVSERLAELAPEVDE